MMRVCYKFRNTSHWVTAGYCLTVQDAKDLIDPSFHTEDLLEEQGDYVFSDDKGNVIDVNISEGVY